MCAEKIQRLLMAIVLSVALILFIMGHTQIAIVIQTFVILMVIVWAFSDFCPSLWFFGKVFGKCPKKD